ncbi:hypothetical protein V9102_07485 [Streptococcus anginosus]|uniref:hypothetical protein n=1 Tax=Streptococcus anginosus TaxID=1328 RepID=UPI00300FCB35
MLGDKYFVSSAKNKIITEAQKQIVFFDTQDSPLRNENLKRRLIASGMTEVIADAVFGISSDEYGNLERLNHTVIFETQDFIKKYYTNAVKDNDTIELGINPISSLSEALNLSEAYILFVLKDII